MTGGVFLFVNKNAASAKLTQCSGPERRKIYSHAQQEHSNRAAATASQLAATAPWTVVQFDDSGSPRVSPLQKTSMKTKKTKQHAPAHAPVDTICRSLTPPVDVFLQQICKSLPTSLLIQPLTPPDDVDVAPQLFPHPSLARISSQYFSTLATQDDFMRNAWSYFICTRLLPVADLQSENHHVATITSKQNALRHLRHILATMQERSVKLSDCYAIGLLIWAECIAGNVADMEAHAAGLKHLYPRARHHTSSSTAPDYILRIICACSSLCAEALKRLPPIEPTQVPGYLELPSKARACLDGLSDADYQGQGRAFFTPASIKLLGNTLLPMAIELQEIVALREMAAQSGEAPAHDVVRLVCMKEALLEYRLSSLQLDVSLDDRQQAVRVTLLLYSSVPLIAATGSSAALLRTLARKLRQYLNHPDLLSHWAPSCDVLLWVLILGGLVSYQSQDWAWFKFQAFKVMDATHISSFSQLTSRLRNCYYSKYLDPAAKSIWNEFEQVIGSPSSESE